MVHGEAGPQELVIRFHMMFYLDFPFTTTPPPPPQLHAELKVGATSLLDSHVELIITKLNFGVFGSQLRSCPHTHTKYVHISANQFDSNRYIRTKNRI